MSTTSVFVELFVCGLQALVWLTLLSTIIVGPLKLDALKDYASVPAGVVVFALAYGIGVILDRVWDWCSTPIYARVRRSHFSDSDSVNTARKAMFSSPTPYIDLIEYIRSRMRVARSTAFNAVLIAILCLLLTLLQPETLQRRMGLWIAAAVAGLSGLAFFAFVQIAHNYFRTLKNFGNNG